jgi:hypothetical protein
VFNKIFVLIYIILVVFRGPCAARVTPLEEGYEYMVIIIYFLLNRKPLCSACDASGGGVSTKP